MEGEAGRKGRGREDPHILLITTLPSGSGSAMSDN
jgi:hypothetical protein